MTDLRRRLRKLELVWTDGSGLVPHSPAWMDYWMKECERAFADEGGPRKLIPLEAFRAWLQAQPDTDDRYHTDVQAGESQKAEQRK